MLVYGRFVLGTMPLSSAPLHASKTEPATLQFPDNSTLEDSPSLSKRRKDLFGDCALVEIIHLHDCLRGALRALERDVEALKQTLLRRDQSALNELECRVNGRFKVIWSVFRAHSSAEDEFIWPALQLKTQGLVKNSPHYTPDHDHASHSSGVSSSSEVMGLAQTSPLNTNVVVVEDDTVMDQEAYEEDHADEERMFSKMDDLLNQLREALLREPCPESNATEKATKSVDEIIKSVHELTRILSQHLMAHLEKEEKQCLPLVVKHLSKSEIHDLVGQIMGKRSSDMISEIMTMAVQSLNQSDRLEMVKYMKQAMAGTFFDKWLSMSGWMEDVKATVKDPAILNADDHDRKRSVDCHDEGHIALAQKRTKLEFSPSLPNLSALVPSVDDVARSTFASGAAPPAIHDPDPVLKQSAGEITSQAELEKLIRAIASNPTLTPQQKNTTIQGLRDSVWKSNQKLKAQLTASTPCTATSTSREPATIAKACVSARRVTPPSAYYKNNANGKLEVVWDSDNPTATINGQVPLFSASELAPTYHDGARGAVLGCPHYARACKLRHPVSGRLYTCRLCCEQEREMPSKDQDEPLDRYAVQEVMCMKCNALQPADDRCVNPKCESNDKPFAQYFCKICHLYDDRPRPIFHCPYCNTCRMGQGLGIDFRHCMRCNACVSLDDHEHRCIPQKLQGSCPICHESLFQSTKPLRGLKCGHVMHLSCFTDYRRGQRYTCPLCMKSMEDMTDYFALLDAAVRMQPMPMAYASAMSNVYCQDCEKTGQCRYHFVGQKCPHCGSYNTRDLGRVPGTETTIF